MSEHPDLQSEQARYRAAWGDALAFTTPLSLPGLVILLTLAAGSALLHAGIQSIHFRFLEYALFALFLTVSQFALAGSDTRCRRGATAMLSLCLLLVCAAYDLRHGNRFVFVFSVLQAIFLVKSGWLSTPGPDARKALPISRTLAAWVVILAGWTVAICLPWWVDFTRQTVASSYFAGAFVACFAIVSLAIYRRDPEQLRRPWESTLTRIWDIAVIVLIVLASLRTAGLFGYLAMQHWGVYIAPMEMVRQGGWLLWDVPSQYGFLSILTIAWLPVKSAWTTFYIVLALCQAATASFTYVMLASMRSGTANRLFAAGTTLATSFLISTMFEGMLGPQKYPSIESYRFIWVYACIAILCLVYRRSLRGQSVGTLLAVGSVCWILGVAWAFDSAYYTSATWLPAYYLMLWQMREQRRNGPAAPANDAVGEQACALPYKYQRSTIHYPLLRYALLPPALFILAMAIVCGCYHVRLGHLPDWYAYVEYVRSFQNGFGEFPLDLHGSIWVPVVFCLVPATVALTLFRRSRVHPGVPLLIGAAAMVLAVSSYCMGRSHPNNILNILPFCVLAGSLAIRLSASLPEQSNLPFWVRTCLVPAFVIMMAGSVNTPSAMRDWFKTTLVRPSFQVESRMPAFNNEANALLASAHVSPTDPLLFYDLNLPSAQRGAIDGRPRTYWTPYSPLAAVTPLEPQRAAAYMERFAKRTRAGGWMLIPRTPNMGSYDESWVMPSLSRMYTKTRSYETPNFELVYLRYNGALPP